MKRPFLFYSIKTVNLLEGFVLHKKSSLSSQLAGKRMLSPEETNQLIYQAIKKDIPFFAGRFGGFELSAVIKHLENKLHVDSVIAEKLTNNAGLFNVTDEVLNQFAALYLESAKELDLIGRHWNGLENYVIRVYAPDSQITDMFYLEPWYPGSVHPWTKALEGKKVLVIHPFVNSIETQYQKREKLFEDPDMLPEFELKTIKAVQTIAGTVDPRFSAWFDALEYMYQEAMKTEFDVALIGCGAYGFPLAARLKASGKKAIHMGGMLQILFGIKGARWETVSAFEYVKKLFNEHWIYPLDTDRVEHSEKVEDNCYWNKKEEKG